MEMNHDRKKERQAYRYAAITTIVVVGIWLSLTHLFPEEKTASEVNETLLRDFLEVLDAEQGQELRDLNEERKDVDFEAILQNVNEEEL